jgi:hypothetical protein
MNNGILGLGQKILTHIQNVKCQGAVAQTLTYDARMAPGKSFVVLSKTSQSLRSFEMRRLFMRQNTSCLFVLQLA